PEESPFDLSSIIKAFARKRVTADMFDFYGIFPLGSPYFKEYKHLRVRDCELNYHHPPSRHNDSANTQLLKLKFEDPNICNKVVHNFANVRQLAIYCPRPEENLNAIQLAYMLLHWSNLKR